MARWQRHRATVRSRGGLRIGPAETGSGDGVRRLEKPPPRQHWRDMTERRRSGPPTCVVCRRLVHAKRLCWRHYQQERRAQLRAAEDSGAGGSADAFSGPVAARCVIVTPCLGGVEGAAACDINQRTSAQETPGGGTGRPRCAAVTHSSSAAARSMRPLYSDRGVPPRGGRGRPDHGLVGHQHSQAVRIAWPSHIEVLLHRVSRAQQRHDIDASGLYRCRGRVGNVQQRHVHSCLHGVCEPVHGICTEDDGFRTPDCQVDGRSCEQTPGVVPSACCLQRLDICELNDLMSRSADDTPPSRSRTSSLMTRSYSMDDSHDMPPRRPRRLMPSPCAGDKGPCP